MGDTSSFKLTSLNAFFFRTLALYLLFLSSVFAQEVSKKAQFYHNLYNKYYSEPTDGFDALLANTGVEKDYVIQRGDNLYDISATLFGTPNFWPKIWSINSSLGNPHLIYEGRVISFTEGTIGLAPEISIGDKKTDTEAEKPVQAQSASDLLKGASEKPKEVSKIIDRPPIPLPASLPSFAADIKAEREEFKAISSVKAKIRSSYIDPLVYRPRSYISTKIPKSEGKVRGIFRGGANANYGETIILKSRNKLNIGETLITFNNPESKRNVAGVGQRTYLIRRTGIVRVDKSLGKSRYLAEVVESFDFISKGDDLYRGTLRDISIERNEYPTALVTAKEVEVIGGELEYGRRVLGLGDIVYLSKGRNANIELDKLYLVYTNRSIKVLEPGVKYAKNLPVSLAKVIDLEDKVATAILVDNVDEVSAGDYLNFRERNDF